MHTLFGYLKYYSFDSIDVRPISPEDSVVLTAVSYLMFENVMGYSDVRSFQELRDFTDQMSVGALLPPLVLETYELMLKTERFKDLIVENVYFIADIKAQCRISACTYRFNKNTIVVSFRGTDLSLLAWKEDFNLGYNTTIPGHIESLNYLTDVIKKNPGANVYVCGHSKGANLATFSSCRIDPELAKQIVTVYDLDGPGFSKDFFDTPDYLRMESKFTRLIPHDDIVGQLLTHNPDFKVVKTLKLMKVAQHAQFIWLFKDGRLKYAKRVSNFTNRFSYLIKKLLKQTPDSDIAVLTQKGFKVFEDAGIVYLHDFFIPSRKRQKRIIQNYESLSPEDRDIIMHLIRMVAKAYLIAEFDILFITKKTVSFKRKPNKYIKIVAQEEKKKIEKQRLKDEKRLHKQEEKIKSLV